MAHLPMCQVNNERERNILGEKEDQIGREPIRWRRRRKQMEKKRKKMKKKKVSSWEIEREKKKTFDFWCSNGWKSIGRKLKLFYSTRATSRCCFILISVPNSIPKRRNYGCLAL